jgi:hypothetical protein
VLVALRGDALVCVNLSAAPVLCEVRADTLAGELRDEWSGDLIGPPSDGVLRLSFRPWQPRVLRPSGSSA